MIIRREEKGDYSAVRTVNTSAFESPAEANLVEALRREAETVVSLVAEENGFVVGHILFSPVLLSGRPDLKIMGLAPMAVEPGHQRRGIGRRRKAISSEARSWAADLIVDSSGGLIEYHRLEVPT